MRNIFSLPTIVLLLLVGTAVAEEPASTILYDFEAKDALAAWENLVLEQSKEQEPAVKLEQVAEYATSGKQSLKLTFSGGNWPTVTTTKVSCRRLCRAAVPGRIHRFSGEERARGRLGAADQPLDEDGAATEGGQSHHRRAAAAERLCDSRQVGESRAV